MSVPKGKRNLSSMEFINTARDLRIHTIKVAKKLPKSYTFFLSQNLVNLANDIHNDVKMANSIFPQNDHEFQMRRDYLIDARCKIQALCSSVEVTEEIVKESLSAHNVCKFGELIDRELSLISGVIKKDKDSYKKRKEKETKNSTA